MALHRIVGFALTSRDGGLHWRTSVAQIGLATALAVGTTRASAAVARAGDYDDPSGASFGSQILKSIGLPDPDHPEYEINYSERSPLVVPPNRNLPAPIAGDKPPTPNCRKIPTSRSARQQRNRTNLCGRLIRSSMTAARYGRMSSLSKEVRALPPAPRGSSRRGRIGF